MVRDNAGWAAMLRRFRTGLLGILGDAFHRWNASSGDPAAVCPVRVARESLASGMTLLRLTGKLDVHFISSLPVMPPPACMAWADTRPVQIVGAAS